MFAPFIQEGMGVHTGDHSRVLVEMGLPGTGVVFFVDGREIPAKPDFTSRAQKRATALVSDKTQIGTVEHLLSALCAFGETDVRVIVEGTEIPILDGSALPWALSLSDSGAEPGPCFVRILDEVCVKLNSSWARIVPLDSHNKPSIKVVIDFDRPEIGRQEITFSPLDDDFTQQIAPARTFAFESEIDGILKAGLARGGSLDNALVIGSGGPLNPDGQRFVDEPARHKLLDAIGDLFLLGGIPWAEVNLFKPGHGLLHELTRRAQGLCGAVDAAQAGAIL